MTNDPECLFMFLFVLNVLSLVMYVSRSYLYLKIKNLYLHAAPRFMVFEMYHMSALFFIL